MMEDGKRSCDVLIKKRASRPGFKTIACQTPDNFLVEMMTALTASVANKLQRETLSLSKRKRNQALHLVKLEATATDDEATVTVDEKIPVSTEEATAESCAVKIAPPVKLTKPKRLKVQKPAQKTLQETTVKSCADKPVISQTESEM